MANHRANIAMPSSSVPSATAPVFRIDIPLLPESAVGNALQFIDLLRSANLLAGLWLGSSGPRPTWRPLDAKGVPLPTLPGPLAAYTPPPAEPHNGPPCAVFIPSFHAADIPAIRSVVARNQPLVRQIGIALDAGQKVFALGQDIAEDGLWISGALPLSVGDLAVALVRHTLGSELAQACASVLAPDHERTRAALQANAKQHIPATRDSTLARAIAWMEAHLDEPYSLARLAEAAAVSPRTLLRHFQQELSQSPLDHLHGLRCARAKVLLEVTLESVPSIAVACGYSDPAAFRRIFVRYTGMAPGEYRKRHALRAPRRRWRLDVGA